MQEYGFLTELKFIFISMTSLLQFWNNWNMGNKYSIKNCMLQLAAGLWQAYPRWLGLHIMNNLWKSAVPC
jgi:hypothetical protein